jgi:hypothetical protein
LIHLPVNLRDKIRKFVTDCAIRRGEIGNHLATFNGQWAVADQLQAQGNGPESQRVRAAASAGPLAAAHRALATLVNGVSGSTQLVNEINAA